MTRSSWAWLVVWGWVWVAAAPASAETVTVRPNEIFVDVPGGSSASAAISESQPRGGYGSIEMTSPLGSEGAAVAVGFPAPAARFSDLVSLGFDWYIDSASTDAAPPSALVCFYPDDDPKAFCLSSDVCPSYCDDRPTDAWQTTTHPTSALTIVPIGASAPGSLDEIAADAPIVLVAALAAATPLTSWHGFVDQITIGLTGAASKTFDFEPWVGEVLVFPGDPRWLASQDPPSSVARISGYEPRAGLGSLELAGTALHGANWVTAGSSWDFGTFGDLNVLAADWFLDPASSSAVPPEVALRIYPLGDSRTFWLRWDSSGAPHTTGVWNHSSLLGSLLIEQAEGEPPPASIEDIPADAPIAELHLRRIAGSYWRGCLDEVSVGFTGHPPLTFNFEVQGVYVDDFESGGLCGWTAAVPAATCP